MQQQFFEMVMQVLLDWGQQIPWLEIYQGVKEVLELGSNILPFIVIAKVKSDNDDQEPPQLPQRPLYPKPQSRRRSKPKTKYRIRSRKSRK